MDQAKNNFLRTLGLSTFALGSFLVVSTFTDASANSVHLDDLKVQKFKNNPKTCAADDTCDLEEYTLRSGTYTVNLPDVISYGTRMYAAYKTKDPATLEKYGLAQFIRGCTFHSTHKDGKTLKNFDFAYELDGKFVDYLFPNYVIDGFVPDPLDWGSIPNASSRWNFYRWSPVPDTFNNNKNSHYVIESPPQTSELYVQDHPSTAYLNSITGEATNHFIQLRTCLYKAADVPKSVDPTQIDFAKPIQCFDWNSSFIYNFETNQMESPSGTVAQNCE